MQDKKPASPAKPAEPVPWSEFRSIEFEAPWATGFRFVTEDDESLREDLFNPFDALEDLPDLKQRALQHDPAAAFALFKIARACEQKTQRKALEDYSEVLAQRCQEVDGWTDEMQQAWLWLASDAAVPSAPMQALSRVDWRVPAGPQQSMQAQRAIEAMERAAAKDGRLEDVVTLAVHFERGHLVAQDLRKAVAYYQIAGEASGDTRYAVHAAGLRNQLRGPDIEQVKALQARIFARRQQVLRERAAR